LRTVRSLIVERWARSSWNSRARLRHIRKSAANDCSPSSDATGCSAILPPTLPGRRGGRRIDGPDHPAQQ